MADRDRRRAGRETWKESDEEIGLGLKLEHGEREGGRQLGEGETNVPRAVEEVQRACTRTLPSPLFTLPPAIQEAISPSIINLASIEYCSLICQTQPVRESTCQTSNRRPSWAANGRQRLVHKVAPQPTRFHMGSPALQGFCMPLLAIPTGRASETPGLLTGFHTGGLLRFVSSLLLTRGSGRLQHTVQRVALLRLYAPSLADHWAAQRGSMVSPGWLLAMKHKLMVQRAQAHI